MNKISISESCLGENILIDNESLSTCYSDTRTLEEIKNLRLKLLNELVSMVDKLEIYDFKAIAEIIVNRNKDYQYIEKESNSNMCDQCGNYNYQATYIKK